MFAQADKSITLKETETTYKLSFLKIIDSVSKGGFKIPLVNIFLIIHRIYLPRNYISEINSKFRVN